MECPWKQTSRTYADYSQEMKSGKPVTVIEQVFGKCSKEECPFYGSKDGKDPMCLRTFRR